MQGEILRLFGSKLLNLSVAYWTTQAQEKDRNELLHPLHPRVLGDLQRQKSGRQRQGNGHRSIQ